MRPLSKPTPIELGWDLLDSDDLEGARAALRTAAGELGADEAEVLNLAGAIAAAEGEYDQAIELFMNSHTADPDNFNVLVQAAEVEYYGRGDARAALDLTGRVLEGTQDNATLSDVILLRAECELDLGDDEAARATMERLDGRDVEWPEDMTRAGNILLALGDLPAAEEIFLAAIEDDPEDADAHYGLGSVYEAREDHKAMVQAWLDTRRLDAAAPPLPWHMSLDEFEKVAEEAMAELPDEILGRLENVPILIEDVPSEEIVKEGYDPRLMGLFSGVPLPHKSHAMGQAPVIDAIHIFQKNLERMTSDRDELADEIRITVIHETAHFFGLEDDDLDLLGLG
jgi:predicted Zn-dependent protease with MMP-like domain/Tfp pilus assembly protein PilF